jgi:hypothetical protein
MARQPLPLEVLLRPHILIATLHLRVPQNRAASSVTGLAFLVGTFRNASLGVTGWGAADLESFGRRDRARESPAREGSEHSGASDSLSGSSCVSDVGASV